METVAVVGAGARLLPRDGLEQCLAADEPGPAAGHHREARLHLLPRRHQRGLPAQRGPPPPHPPRLPVQPLRIPQLPLITHSPLHNIIHDRNKNKALAQAGGPRHRLPPPEVRKQARLAPFQEVQDLAGQARSQPLPLAQYRAHPQEVRDHQHGPRLGMHVRWGQQTGRHEEQRVGEQAQKAVELNLKGVI